MVRRWAIITVVGFVGCESLKTSPASTEPPVAQMNPSPTPPLKREGLNPNPAPPSLLGKGVGGLGSSEEDDPLALAADCIERGEHAKAAVHLEARVRVHPDQLMFRAQLAELLMRAGRDEAAKVHFEQFATDARRATGPAKKHLVNVHTRLMEIGQQNGDRYAEVLHRGIGLLLLVEEQDGLPDRDADFCEEMLCQSMKALAEAKELNPNDMQVRLRLADVYDRMGNRRGADAERNIARASVVPTGEMPPLALRE